MESAWWSRLTACLPQPLQHDEARTYSPAPGPSESQPVLADCVAPTLAALPLDVLSHVTSFLPPSSIGSLACTHRALSLPDEAFRRLLEKRATSIIAHAYDLALSALEPDAAVPDHNLICEEDVVLLLLIPTLLRLSSRTASGGTWRSIAHEALRQASLVNREVREVAASAVAAVVGHGDDGSAALTCREAGSVLHSHSCAICHVRGTSGVWFPLTRRGACLACTTMRGGVAERWRRQQAAAEEERWREEAAATRGVLLGALSDELELSLRSGAQAGNVSLSLLFDSTRNGGSCAALLRAARDSPATLLVVRERERSAQAIDLLRRERRRRDHEGGAGGHCDDGAHPAASNRSPAAAPAQPRLFGAFVPSAWPLSSSSTFFGAKTSFLFSLTPPQRRPASAAASPARPPPATPDSNPSHTEPSACFFRATGRDEHYAYVDTAAGIGFGGDPGSFSLSIDADLSRGHCMPSLTYGDVRELASAGAHFVCDAVQLWSVDVGGTADGAGGRNELATVGGSRRKKAAWEEDPATVLEPGMNKLMLEFVGIEKEVAMLRRYS